jgi:hypothetical protein
MAPMVVMFFDLEKMQVKELMMMKSNQKKEKQWRKMNLA